MDDDRVHLAFWPALTLPKWAPNSQKVTQKPKFVCRIQPNGPLPREKSRLFTLTTKQLLLLKNRERAQQNRDKQTPRTKKRKREEAAEYMRRKRHAQRVRLNSFGLVNLVILNI